MTVWQSRLSCKSLLSYVCIDFSLGTWVVPLQGSGDIPVVMRLLLINTRQASTIIITQTIARSAIKLLNNSFCLKKQLKELTTGTVGHSVRLSQLSHILCHSIKSYIRKWRAFTHFNEPFRPCNKPFLSFKAFFPSAGIFFVKVCFYSYFQNLKVKTETKKSL